MQSKKPNINSSCFIADTAVIIGDVVIKKQCGIYPHAVLRGDENKIQVDEGSNIQDGCVIHVDADHSTHIGKHVSIGHMAMVHGATIEDNCLIGIHATVLNGAVIKKGSIIGAHALVTADTIIPENSLVLGIPGKVIKKDESLEEKIKENAAVYTQLSKKYKNNEFSFYEK